MIARNASILLPLKLLGRKMQALYYIHIWRISLCVHQKHHPKNGTVSSWNTVPVVCQIANGANKNNIKPRTFYNWVRRFHQDGHIDIPSCTGHDSYKGALKQEVVKIDFAEPSVQIPISEPSMESNYSHYPLKVTPSIMHTLGKCSMYISNETDPFFLAHIIKILKELSC